jgi:plasmanylethanolamine desaturase
VCSAGWHEEAEKSMSGTVGAAPSGVPGYSRTWRFVEMVSIAAFFVFDALLVSYLSVHLTSQPWALLAGFMVGWVGADVVSGVVHWLADTWGTLDTPLVGKALLRPFREHHVDQQAICHHDFIELNGANCFISLPAIAVGFLLPLATGSAWATFLGAALFSLVTWVFVTNMVHAAAHADAPPKLVQLLQRMKLILGPEHHALHHASPYAKHYCITTGWMNHPLDRIGFFRTLEHWVTRLTGAVARQDDLKLPTPVAPAEAAGALDYTPELSGPA